MLNPGDRVWVNIPRVGFVGVCEVLEPACPAADAQFEWNGELRPFSGLPLSGHYVLDAADGAEVLVKVRWIKSVPEREAVREIGFFGNQNIVCRPTSRKWTFTVQRLNEIWALGLSFNQ